MNEFDFSAGQSFITEVKRHWHTELYQTLEAEYKKLEATAKDKPKTTKDIEQLLESNTTYQVFAWMERNMQKFKYSGRYGLINWYSGKERDDAGAASKRPGKNLHLAPDLEMPKYYVSCDIHQHPGGVWSHETGGKVYQHAAQTTTPLDGDQHADLHWKFVEVVKEKYPDPKRILEIGCGFGKTTKPLKEAFPDAEIVAIDLSGPCLEEAAAVNPDVEFFQMDAANTSFEDSSFDLIVSSMLLHEMPPKYIEKLTAESNRLLSSSGSMIHFDFYTFPSLFRKFMHFSHGRRNNEPFMEPLAEMDLAATLKAHGFASHGIEPFAEEPGVFSETFNKWRYPWTTITAAKA